MEETSRGDIPHRLGCLTTNHLPLPLSSTTTIFDGHYDANMELAMCLASRRRVATSQLRPITDRPAQTRRGRGRDKMCLSLRSEISLIPRLSRRHHTLPPATAPSLHSPYRTAPIPIPITQALNASRGLVSGTPAQ